jgi:non-ribosomal peptide synthetase component F
MDLANRLAEQGERVFNLYGPTETTVWATGHLLGGSASEEQPIAIAPIGHPLAHVQSYVVDEK